MYTLLLLFKAEKPAQRPPPPCPAHKNTQDILFHPMGSGLALSAAGPVAPGGCRALLMQFDFIFLPNQKQPPRRSLNRILIDRPLPLTVA